MATIGVEGSVWRHARKTVTFTGGAGAGQLNSAITVFTITGRVMVKGFVAYCSSALVCAAGSDTTLNITSPKDDLLITVSTANGTGFPDFLTDFLETSDALLRVFRGPTTTNPPDSPEVISANVVITPTPVITGANITGGVLIFDIWYTPITDNGALAGDDIDTGVLGVDVVEWLGTAPATPTVAGVPEVDLTHVAGATTNVAALATNVDAILTDTADMQPKLGSPAGASISADILTIDNLVDDLESRLGTPSDLGSGATVAANLVDIEGQTDDIGAAGAGLTAADDAILAILGTPAGASLAADIAAIEAQTDDIGAAGAGLTAITDRLPAALVSGRIDASVGAVAAGAITAAAIATGAIDADALAADAVAEIWTTALTESYNADGAAPTAAQAFFLIMQALTEFSISGTTLTIKKLDGSTTAATLTLNSATSPSSVTRAS